MCPVDKLVDRLNELLVQLLDLHLLLRPIVGVDSDVDAMDLLVVLDERLDRFWRKLEGDLVSQDHVDVDDVCLDVDELIVEQCLDERIRVLLQVGIRCLLKHDRRQGPYRICRRQCLGQTSMVLCYAVERTLDPVYPFQSLRQPWLYFRSEDDVD